jgi:Zn ribbon nucleic-acid-binding protein
MNKIIGNCHLCEEHSLHIIGEGDVEIMQCINCGYVSTSKLTGENIKVEYEKLTDDMKKWSKELHDRLWIPTIMTLPIGMLYPIDITAPNDKEDKVMKWAFAPMVKITEEEKEKYPNGEGGYYEKRMDTDNPNIYDKFIEGYSLINKLMKQKNSNGSQ